jgi:hypothetical protein
MVSPFPYLAVSQELHGDLVIAATVLFLIFAAYALIVSAHAQRATGQTAERDEIIPGDSPRRHLPVASIAIIVGLICAFVILAFAGC